MATISATSTTDAYATMGGVRYQLCITTRISDDAPASLKSEQLQGMVAHTIATWQRAMQAILTGTWAIAEFGGKVWPSAEEKQGVSKSGEPYVTVWNKGGAPINITVQSWDNGVYALESAKDMLAGLEKFKAHASAFGFEAFEYTSVAAPAKPAPRAFNPPFDSNVVEMLKSGKPVQDAMRYLRQHTAFTDAEIDQYLLAVKHWFDSQNAPKAPAQPKQPDINNVDDYIPPYAEKAVKRHNDIAQVNNTTKGNFFIRSAMEGSIDGLIKLESGAKDKKTWQNGILARKPYDPKAVEYKEKDLIAYPVTGAITVKSWPDGTRYLEIPSVGANIQIKEKPATVYQDKNIPSDWQTLIQHLSLTDKEIPVGLSLQVPASHIVMSISKPATDKDGNPVQFKNYRGLYQLQVESQTA